MYLNEQILDETHISNQRKTDKSVFYISFKQTEITTQGLKALISLILPFVCNLLLLYSL